jgi:predicted transcriptional regulator of viral defense system
VDSFLVAAKSAEDAVLGYHTALEFFGRAYSTFQRLYFLTAAATRPFHFRSIEFRGVPFPRPLVARRKQTFGVKQVPRSGASLRVTTLERTLVDVLDRPELAGGWEEVWRSLDSVEYFDVDLVVEYALLLDNSTTVAKVGYYLEQNQKRLMAETKHLNRLERNRPRKPHYMQPGTRGGELVARWNLIVPSQVTRRTWEET